MSLSCSASQSQSQSCTPQWLGPASTSLSELKIDALASLNRRPFRGRRPGRRAYLQGTRTSTPHPTPSSNQSSPREPYPARHPSSLTSQCGTLPMLCHLTQPDRSRPSSSPLKNQFWLLHHRRVHPSHLPLKNFPYWFALIYYFNNKPSFAAV